MKKIIRIVLIVVVLIIVAGLLLRGCPGKPLEAPPPPPYVNKTPDNWPVAQKAKTDQIKNYKDAHWTAYDWFGNFAFSESDGIPYVILKMLPVLAPELWGSKENFLDAVGLFMDERQPDYLIARGVGVSGFSRPEPFGKIDYSSFTCGACHIGRVRLDNGKYTYLDGGINAEFNIVLFRVKILQTLTKIYAGETDSKKKYKKFTDALLASLDRVHKSDPNYFYKNYKVKVNDKVVRVFDTEYEAKQIALFKAGALEYATAFAQRKEAEVNGYLALVKKNYTGFDKEMTAGFPGMADATGISSINGYMGLEQKFYTRWLATLSLPDSPGITDFMSVWEQGKRKAEWNKTHDQLINGGGQWNGNVPMPRYRNLIAQLTLGLNETDVRVAVFGDELLDGLPAVPYPFDVDIKLAKKGEDLFAKNCAACHQPRNGKVYKSLGTSMGRAYVVNAILNYGGRAELYANCNTTTVVKMNGKDVKPCAEYEGVSLEGKKDLLMADYRLYQGYNARPLSGIWAQAPYLHNGSVPTMYHLLVPGERPKTFMKSRLDYDKKLMGFSWDAKVKPTTGKDEGYEFNTALFPALNRIGHDADVREDGQTYKLDWTDDKEGAWAIIEYMKTL
ncbi:MAG: cytochrome C [Gammaproteobacteria bacterium]|nr:cytochrome C [Gammaproteobacteria bacterium]MDH5652702.1 cytochrome C [Gammaproteobacteria bacterium]